VKVVERAVIDVVRVWDIVVRSVLAAAVTVIRVTKKSVSVERPIELMVVVVSVLKKFVLVVSVEKLVEIIDVLVEVLVETVMETKATAKVADATSPATPGTGGLAHAPMHAVTVIAYKLTTAAGFAMKEPRTTPFEIEHESAVTKPLLGEVILHAVSDGSNPQPETPTGVPGGPDH